VNDPGFSVIGVASEAVAGYYLKRGRAAWKALPCDLLYHATTHISISLRQKGYLQLAAAVDRSGGDGASGFDRAYGPTPSNRSRVLCFVSLSRSAAPHFC
jgi:hypothetical protein